MRWLATVLTVSIATTVLPFVSDAWGQETGDWLQVVTDMDAGELVFIVGPVDLPAGIMHHAIRQPPLLVGEVPVEGYLYGFDVEMVDPLGQPITNRVLHHVNLIDADNRELFGSVPRRLFAAGGETRAASMPRLLGVPIERGQQLLVSAMFHNPTAQSFHGARLRVRLKYRTRGWIFPISVYPVYLDVMGHVGEKDFDLPPGRSERSWEGKPAIGGRLLAVGGHLHDHATRLSFEDVTEGEVLWETGPELDEAGRVVAVPVGKLWWKGGIRLDPGHTYRLTVAYDNPTGETLVDGGMGVLGGIFLPQRGSSWPALDRTNPEYLANMEEMRVTAERRAQGMGGDHGHAR
ncbi:MAG: hypothetical protein JSU87_05835 [Gemmatimonadota bacterium]|nr:MAG: hypothetical protein JSU87_05835 [Gemmatimonadota bacterium]